MCCECFKFCKQGKLCGFSGFQTVLSGTVSIQRISYVLSKDLAYGWAFRKQTSENKNIRSTVPSQRNHYLARILWLIADAWGNGHGRTGTQWYRPALLSRHPVICSSPVIEPKAVSFCLRDCASSVCPMGLISPAASFSPRQCPRVGAANVSRECWWARAQAQAYVGSYDKL